MDPSSPNFFQVKEIFESDSTFEAIGILPERLDVINNYVAEVWDRAMKTNRQKSDIVQELTSICKTPAETFYLGIVFSHLEMHEATKSAVKEMRKGMLEFFKHIAKDLENDD